jgi:hypothetical protein
LWGSHFVEYISNVSGERVSDRPARITNGFRSINFLSEITSYQTDSRDSELGKACAHKSGPNVRFRSASDQIAVRQAK